MTTRTLFLSLAAFASLMITPAAAASPAEGFFKRLSTLCGQSFAGKVVTTDPADDSFRKADLIMTVAQCSPEEIRIPFAVGEDRSRTWVIRRIGPDRLSLKHDHRHSDGTEDALSQYGGLTVSAGMDSVQAFPADAFSKALFERLDRAVSVTNVWELGVTQTTFAYQLSRPNRLFRVEFDLRYPLEDSHADHKGHSHAH
ncbi:MAG: hypothetical protein ACK41P_11000 [Asticcacaulis sp.]